VVGAEHVEQRAVLPLHANVHQVGGEGENPLRREKESEVHENHLQSRVNQRTPARSGKA
jgi:hypothetical protein